MDCDEARKFAVVKADEADDHLPPSCEEVTTTTRYVNHRRYK
jgi:hypothetical protein